MSNKWGKALLGAAVAGTALAVGALYYTRKKQSADDCDFDFDDEFEDEDFDLDEDLKPVEREYVSLTPSPAPEASEEASEEETAEEEPVVED